MSKHTKTYGRPYVDYYPMPSTPPRGSASSVREPHGSEPAFPWWIRTAAAGKSRDMAVSAKGVITEKPSGGGKCQESGTEAETKGDCKEAPTIKVEITEIGQEEATGVMATGDRYTCPVSVVQPMEETPDIETSVAREDPEITGSKSENTVVNTAGTVPKEPKSRALKGPVCDPPHNP